MSHPSSASNEFLDFLADIYDPGTGVVSQARLACWLGLREFELEARWQQSARVDRGRFANEVL